MLSWPDSQRFKTYLLLNLILFSLFGLIYFSTNAYATSQTQLYHLWLPFELQIPLIPEFILIYCSVNFLTILPLFALNSDQLKRMGRAIAMAFVIAGIIFYFFPAPVGFIRNLEMARFNIIFKGLYFLDESTNTFPSLHIGLSFIVTRIMVYECHNLKPLWLWFFLISLSVLFTHQHHLIDIFGGILLGEICIRSFYFQKKSFIAARE